MNLEYNKEIEVTKSQWSYAVVNFAGYVAHRKSEDGSKFWIKPMTLKQRNLTYMQNALSQI